MREFDAIERQKAEMIAELSGWPAASLTCRLAEDGWSAVQVVDHLVRTEEEILALARKGLERPRRLGVRDRFGYVFLDRVFRSERRVKVPGSASMVLPEARPEMAIVLERWTRVRAEMAELIAEVPAERLKVGVFRHPVSGWMSLSQVVGFFSVHLVHHGYQLRRIERAAAG